MGLFGKKDTRTEDQKAYDREYNRIHDTIMDVLEYNDFNPRTRELMEYDNMTAYGDLITELYKRCSHNPELVLPKGIPDNTGAIKKYVYVMLNNMETKISIDGTKKTMTYEPVVVKDKKLSFEISHEHYYAYKYDQTTYNPIDKWFFSCHRMQNGVGSQCCICGKHFAA